MTEKTVSPRELLYVSVVEFVVAAREPGEVILGAKQAGILDRVASGALLRHDGGGHHLGVEVASDGA